jgi:hypothetical protein
MRRVAVGGLRDRAEAVLLQMSFKAGEDRSEIGAGAGRGVDQRADQPGPDRAAVVAAVAVGRPTSMRTAVPVRSGGRTAQTDGR